MSFEGLVYDNRDKGVPVVLPETPQLAAVSQPARNGVGHDVNE
jgi:hypothetical protein